MSDWSVRQLIDEYDSEAAESAGPKRSSYSEALQGVLAAMLSDEPSSTYRPVDTAKAPINTTEEALSALLADTLGSSSPTTSPSEVAYLSSSGAHSTNVQRKRIATTDDAVNYLIQSMEENRSAKSSPKRLSIVDGQSAIRSNPVLAAANRLFEQSRYSLAPDWKVHEDNSPSESDEPATSVLRRDSESGLDRADFALLPPALGRKPLTPLGEKDKQKASTPPEPVVTRTLVTRKRQIQSPPAPPESEKLDQVMPSVRGEVVHMHKVKKAVKNRAGRSRVRDRDIRQKALRAPTPEDSPRDGEAKTSFGDPPVEPPAEKPNADPPVEKTRSPQQAEKEAPKINALDVPRGFDSQLAAEPASPADILPPEAAGVQYDIIDDPAVIELAEKKTRPARRNTRQSRGSAKSSAKMSVKRQSGGGRRKSAETLENAAGPSPDPADNREIKPPPPPSLALAEPPEPPEAPVTASEPDVGQLASAKLLNVPVQRDEEFDSQDSEGQNGALQKLRAIARRATQKPKSPSWVTPRPAGVLSLAAPPPQSAIGDVVADENSAGGVVAHSLEIQLSQPQTASAVVDEATSAGQAEDAMTHWEGNENQSRDSDVSSPTPIEVSNKRKSLPKRRAKAVASKGMELVPVEQSLVEQQPSKRQSHGIQVSALRATASKRKPKTGDPMEPGKLRRISICEDNSDAIEAGKIVRPQSKRIRVPALKWWAGERIEYKSEDGSLGRTVATAVYKKEGDEEQQPARSRPRRLRPPLALPAPNAGDQLVVPQLAQCKLRVEVAMGREWDDDRQRARAVPAQGVMRNAVVIRRADVAAGWDLYKKNDMCFSANVLLQNACFASVLIRLPPSETNGVDLSMNTHMLVEFVSGARLLVLMSHVGASSVDRGEIVGDRKGVELARAGSKVMIPPQYRYQFKNVSETDESLLLTHVLPQNKQT